MLFFAATREQDWAQDPKIPQSYVDVTKTIAAYLSAVFIVGVKILGVVCHGPETKRLVIQTSDAEAAYQLLLVTTIF